MKTIKHEGRTYRLGVIPRSCVHCAFICTICADTGPDCIPRGTIWRETFLSRLRRWWAASIASPLPDELDESHSAVRYAIQDEVMGPSRARIAEKAREAAKALEDTLPGTF